MGLLNTSGIIIKQINFGEADKILTIMTKDYGKLQALARGARRTNNRFLASTQLFCYSNFIFFQGKSMNYINTAELRESFYNLRKNIKDFTYASYIIELMNGALEENQKEEKHFFLLIHTLKHMTYSKNLDLDLIKLTFQIKLMALSGYAPHLSNCVSCGEVLKGKIKFSIENGGTLCSNCFHLDPYGKRISGEEISIISYILYNPLSALSKLEIKNTFLRQLNNIMDTYVSKYLEKSFHTLDFLNIIDSNMNGNNLYKGDGKIV